MEQHKYFGDNYHDFHDTKNCIWCKSYTEDGHWIYYKPIGKDKQEIRTPFCSPKCYHESLEKGYTEKDYYENKVLDFIENGGLHDWLIKEEKRTNFFPSHSPKIEIKKDNPVWMSPSLIITILFCLSLCCSLIWLFLKFIE